MPYSVLEKYQSLVAAQHLSADPAQEALAKRLNRLSAALQQQRLSRKSSTLGWLFGRKEPAAPLFGLYIHGSVGRGKTMLMDLFFSTLDVKRKRRAHFHSFMADVHERIHQWREAAREGKIKGSDPIAAVAEALAEEAWVLCFDEFSVTDIADAMILGRLFSALWSHGVIVVATSNVEPDNLYKDGLNRALFLPFLAQMKEKLLIFSLDAEKDYRREKLGHGELYFSPPDSHARHEIDLVWQRLAAVQTIAAVRVKVRSRFIDVPLAAGGAARFDFAELCSKPLGASDYLELARSFHTIIVENIPAMTLARRNEAKRFITLIDVLYENHVKLIASAEAPVEKLYKSGEGFETFEFDRTISRLIEMRSDEYLQHPHGSKDSQASGLTTGIVET